MNASAAIDNVFLLILGINLVLAGVISLAWLCYSLINKKSTMVKNIMSLVAGVALIGYGANLSINYFSNKESPPVETFLKEQAKEINASLPMMVDKGTRLEEVFASGDVMNYKYTLLDYSADQLDKEGFQTSMEANLKSRQCSDQAIIDYLKTGVSSHYSYYGNKGALIATIVMSKETCGIL